MLYPDDIKKLADMGLDLDKISADYLRTRLSGEYTPEKQALRDLFGDRINRRQGGFEEINAAVPDPVTAEASRAIEEAKKKAEFSICFGEYEADRLTSDALDFCHETYELFDKVHQQQIKGRYEVDYRSAFALSRCTLQIDIRTSKKGSPVSDEEGRESFAISRKRRLSNTGEFQHGKKQRVSFRELFDFASKVCPSYIDIFKKKPDEERIALARGLRESETVIYNITFEEFDCWMENDPSVCLADQTEEKRLDPIFESQAISK